MRFLLLLSVLLLPLCGASAPESDRAIAEEIRARFSKSKIAANGFEVRVVNGVATLTGKTEVVQHKGTATRIARSCGAVEVVNRIQVSDAGRKKAAQQMAQGKARAKPADNRTERKPGAASAPPSGAAEPAQAPPPVRRATVKH